LDCSTSSIKIKIKIKIEIEIEIEIGIRLWGSFSQFVYSDVNHNFLRPPCDTASRELTPV